MLSRCFLDCSVGVGDFVTGLSQISSFFSLRQSQRYISYTCICYGKYMYRRPKEEVWRTVALPCHTHFVWFFKLSVQVSTLDYPFYGYSEKLDPLYRAVCFTNKNKKQFTNILISFISIKNLEFTLNVNKTMTPCSCYFQHQQYNGAGSGIPNDIALLRLAEPADVSKPEIEVVSLPSSANQAFNTRDECYISGWGKTSGKMKHMNV